MSTPPRPKPFELEAGRIATCRRGFNGGRRTTSQRRHHIFVKTDERGGGLRARTGKAHGFTGQRLRRRDTGQRLRRREGVTARGRGADGQWGPEAS